MAKLIIHKTIDVETIPTTSSENIPKKNKATEPLIPISAKVIVGIPAMVKKTNPIEINAGIIPILTLKTSNNK